jgi:hypothetical protein
MFGTPETVYVPRVHPPSVWFHIMSLVRILWGFERLVIYSACMQLHMEFLASTSSSPWRMYQTADTPPVASSYRTSFWEVFGSKQGCSLVELIVWKIE